MYQSLNRFGVSDGGTPEFLDNHKQKILYGKAGVDRDRRSGLSVMMIFVAGDHAVVATRVRNQLVIAPVQFVSFLTFTIERSDRFLVFG
jgi:hypothetical protein